MIWTELDERQRQDIIRRHGNGESVDTLASEYDLLSSSLSRVAFVEEWAKRVILQAGHDRSVYGRWEAVGYLYILIVILVCMTRQRLISHYRSPGV